jgi:lipoprotein-anchoring transpeptidase ErfK/SrfK
MPIALFFNRAVKDKAAVERRLEVTSSAKVQGAWHWFGDEEVRYRPRTYWPAGVRVTLRAGLAGVDAGGGVWGVASRTIRFRIGDRHVSTVNVHSHRMSVTRNGRVVRTMPASTGRDQYPTTNGVHTVLGKERSRIMDSSTVPGIPASEGYRLRVEWAVRISNSGEFVHSAPWSVGAQGRANVSHGCVNLSPANATWFYGFSRRGDIVKVVGSPRKPGQTEGLLEWNRSWAEWLAGSALRGG